MERDEMDDIRSAVDWFEEEIVFWMKAGATKIQIEKIRVLLNLANEVLSCEGFPEKKIVGESECEPLEIEGYNRAIDLCRITHVKLTADKDEIIKGLYDCIDNDSVETVSLKAENEQLKKISDYRIGIIIKKDEQIEQSKKAQLEPLDRLQEMIIDKTEWEGMNKEQQQHVKSYNEAIRRVKKEFGTPNVPSVEDIFNLLYKVLKNSVHKPLLHLSQAAQAIHKLITGG